MSPTTEYKFTVQINDGYGTFEYIFKYPDGGYCVVDLIEAIQQGCPKLGHPDSYKFLDHQKCPPSPTPSSPSTAPAPSAAARPLQEQLRAVLGQESVSQLQLHEGYLSEAWLKSRGESREMVWWVLTLYKTVLALVTPTAGTSSSAPTPKRKD